MKYIMILMLSLYSVGAASQARVGLPLAAVQREMKDNNFNMVQANDSMHVLETMSAYVVYICDQYDVIQETIIHPRHPKADKVYIAYYNKAYKVISPSKWVCNQNGDSAYITRVRTADLKNAYYVWSYSPQLKRSYERLP